MTRKELIFRLCTESDELTIKLLRDFPTIVRDLRAIEDYEEAYQHYQHEKIHAKRQWSRDYILDRYGMGVNTFYEIRKRVEWILNNIDKVLNAG